ncbi:MAG: hypothetical protein ABSE89_12070 [Sedimentisphaerales bacterium]
MIFYKALTDEEIDLLAAGLGDNAKKAQVKVGVKKVPVVNE